MDRMYIARSASDQRGHNWNVTAFMVGTVAHIVSYEDCGGSSYRLLFQGVSFVYYCGCCSAKEELISAAISEVVKQAKAAGATKVVLRKGDSVSSEVFCGLPVEDVKDHVGDFDGVKIYSARD